MISLSDTKCCHLAILYVLPKDQPSPNLQFRFMKNCIHPSIRDGVLRSGMVLYLHQRDSKIFFHPAKFDNFKDEKILDFKNVSVSQRKNLLD